MYINLSVIVLSLSLGKNWDKMLKNQPCDVIKMRKVRGYSLNFYDVTWLIFETLCPVTWETQTLRQSRQNYRICPIIATTFLLGKGISYGNDRLICYRVALLLLKKYNTFFYHNQFLYLNWR